MRRNIHYKPSKSASILSGVIACAMGVFGLFTIPSIGAMIGSGGLVVMDEDTCMVETAQNPDKSRLLP